MHEPRPHLSPLGVQIFIHHFHISHNTLCLPPKILHKHYFQFLLRHAVAPGEMENNAYAKFTKCIMGDIGSSEI